jgi:hypothetical protein
MGVDISGINPILSSPKPEQPDWDTATEQETSDYWKALSEWQEANPGDYFRASWWSWRPIVYLIDHASNLHNLGINTKPMHYNDGEGIKTQEECNRLADILESIIESNEELQEENATIYLCLGSWCTTNGAFVSESIELKLNETYKPGEIFYTPLVMEDGSLVVSSHSVEIEHLREFIRFLRGCGGFQVW